MATATVEIPFSLGPALTEEQARQIVQMGDEAAVWAILQLAKMLAETTKTFSVAADSHDTPSTPSGMKPPYRIGLPTLAKPTRAKARAFPVTSIASGSRAPPGNPLSPRLRLKWIAREPKLLPSRRQ